MTKSATRAVFYKNLKAQITPHNVKLVAVLGGVQILYLETVKLCVVGYAKLHPAADPQVLASVNFGAMLVAVALGIYVFKKRGITVEAPAAA